MGRVAPIADKLWGGVDKSGPVHPTLGTPCWIWTGGKLNADGYGSICADRKRAATHRWAWTLTNGPIPDGLYICHHCDNPPCCNPAHLFVGTCLDNIRDRDAKNRGKTAPHPRVPGVRWTSNQKLTEDGVRQIRSMRAAGDSWATIARAVGVSPRNVRSVLDGTAWKHVA